MRTIAIVAAALSLAACCGEVTEEDFGTIVSADYVTTSFNACDTTVIRTTKGFIPLCGRIVLRVGDPVARIKNNCGRISYRFGTTVFVPR